jgi:hypothetical protein
VPAALVVVAGAFTAGALIFRDRGDRNVAESQIHCDDADTTNKECADRANREIRILCESASEPAADAVRVTIVYESAGEEYARRTYPGDDC